MNKSHLQEVSLGCLALLAFAPIAMSAAPGSDALKAADGFWAYTTLQSPGGEERTLTGVILFKDGVFAQQSIFDGEPFEKQGAMAHAGPYGAGPKGIHMTAEQTISISPERTPALSYRHATQHDISAERNGDALTIVFASGTIQKFKRIGPGAGEIHALENGLLAFVDGYFVLVDGDPKGAVTGYGKFKRNGTAYDLDVIRWSESEGAKTVNRRDVVLKATFDGKTFRLADGRSFLVVPPKK